MAINTEKLCILILSSFMLMMNVELTDCVINDNYYGVEMYILYLYVGKFYKVFICLLSVYNVNLLRNKICYNR